MLTSREIRQQYIDFFVHQHGHTFVQSSPVVPHDDPTLLFTNAGMNQFKPYFLGTEQSPWKRVANTQKCIRAGGKHNDLDDVGRSRRHHTFFEMLGNWSFGDYFKLGAIQMAWELLTKIWKLDPKRLHVSCFEGDEKNGVPRDTEAADIWRKVANWEQYGVKTDDHIHYFGKDNFWEMGDTGPCGPCTEIYIDRRPPEEIEADLKNGKRSPVNAEDPRVMEIWNLVFIQFNRNADRSLAVLPAQHVDTGMGFERITQVIQNVDSNFGIDLWNPFFAKISEISGHKYTALFPKTNSVDPVAEAANPQLRTDIAFRVIADHARCLTFALTDGAVPSNEGRGYVLRRILRRAVTFGYLKLGIKEPFMHKLVDVVVDAMGEAFPELKKNPAGVAAVLKEEEIGFGKTIERGVAIFELAAASSVAKEYANLLGTSWAFVKTGTAGFVEGDETGESKAIQDLSKELVFRNKQSGETKTIPTATALNVLISQQGRGGVITADSAFKLYTTYGFPLDLTEVMAQERGMTVDNEGVKKLMDQHAEISRGADASADATQSLLEIVQQSKLPATEFHGYTQTKMDAVTCVHLYKLDGAKYVPVDLARLNDKVALVLERTCFYAESGGQVGDRGTIENRFGAIVTIDDTIKVGDVFFHLGTVTTAAKAGEGFACAADDSKPHRLTVDEARRKKIASNHTSTHVLNHKLRAVLGDHVMQKGSLVDDEKTRFDFAHNAAISEADATRIEELVNADIAADLPVNWEYAPQQDALQINSLRAVFGEKYPPTVRVVSIGPRVEQLIGDPGSGEWINYSIEFCGGTHLEKTGDAEGFALLSEEAVAKGVRRITAITGTAAHKATAHGQQLLSRVATLRKAPPEQLAELPALPETIAQVTAAMNEQAVPMLLRAKIREGLAELQKIVKEQEKLKSKAAAGGAVEAARALAETVDGTVIVAELPGVDADGLRAAMDVIRKKKPDSALLLGSVEGGKVSFVAAVPDALIKKGLKAGDWVREVAKAAGGGGGGRPDMAHAGGKDPAKLGEALEVGRKFAAGKV
jgi:alanyl-tRNA synthetase